MVKILNVLVCLISISFQNFYAQNSINSLNNEEQGRIVLLKKITDDFLINENNNNSDSLFEFGSYLKSNSIENNNEIAFLWGYFFYQKNDYVNSIRFLLQAKELNNSKDIQYLQAEVLFYLANAYQRLFYLEKSIFYYQKLLDVDNLVLENSRRNRIIMNIGNSYFELKDNLLAFKYYNQAYQNASNQNDSNNIVIGLLNIGSTYQATNDYKQAADFYTKALELSRKYNLKDLIGICLFDLGEFNYVTKNYQESEKYFSESVTELKGGSWDRIIPEIYKYFVLINYEENDYRESLEYCEKFQSQAYKYIVQEKLLRAIKSINNVLTKLESNPKARNLLYQNIQILDTVLFNEIAAKRTLTESLNKLAELEKTNRELEEINIHKDERLKTSYIIIVLIFILLAVITAALILFVKAKNKIKHQNILIRMQFDDIKNKNEETLLLIQQKQQQNEEIKSQNEQLSGYQNQLEQLIKERTSELSNALVKAQESDNLKTFFLQNISHEIRTPLNAISGFSQLLSVDTQTNTKYIEIINQNVTELLKIIDNIIVFSKLQANQLPLNLRQFPLSKLFQNLKYETDQIAQKYQNKEIEFKVLNCLSLDYQINTDFSFLLKILVQLIENAYKFTERGEISLKCDTVNKRIIFDIKDTGIGIKEEKLPYIFEAFRKIEGNNQIFRGTGIGLALVNKLVCNLSGELEILSEFGVGTTITVAIPIKD